MTLLDTIKTIDNELHNEITSYIKYKHIKTTYVIDMLYSTNIHYFIYVMELINKSKYGNRANMSYLLYAHLSPNRLEFILNVLTRYGVIDRVDGFYRLIDSNGLSFTYSTKHITFDKECIRIDEKTMYDEYQLDRCSIQTKNTLLMSKDEVKEVRSILKERLIGLLSVDQINRLERYDLTIGLFIQWLSSSIAFKQAPLTVIKLQSISNDHLIKMTNQFITENMFL